METHDAATRSYIDTGDRVIVKSGKNQSNGFGGSNIAEQHEGLHGLVLSNDGWGHCSVLLDNGETISCWNGANLEWEADPDS
jgi:hypothetical protein